MSNLRDLTSRRLGSDGHLDKLTGLTSLYIEFPSHEFTPPALLLYEDGDRFHLNNTLEYMLFLTNLPLTDKAAYGRGIAGLPLLEHLTLDFAIPEDDYNGANAMLNRFMPDFEDHILIHSILGPSGDSGWFENLKTVTCLNVGSRDHFLAEDKITAFEAEYSSIKGLSGRDILRKAIVGEGFDSMPALELFKVQVLKDEFPSTDVDTALARTPTTLYEVDDKGDVLTEPMYTEEDGILFLNVRFPGGQERTSA